MVVVVLLAASLVVRHALFQSAAASGPTAGAHQVLTAQPGDSYWSLAAKVSPGGDLRSTVDELVSANGGHDLRVGDRIVLPD